MSNVARAATSRDLADPCRRAFPFASLALVLAGCAGPTPPAIEATSLTGRPLSAPSLTPEQRDKRTRELAAAEADLARAPDDPDALIWVGRRQAYLGRFRDAIATFTRGVERFPSDARFLRHRGHRWITLRDFDRAVFDLARAAQRMLAAPDAVEPDGLPNAKNVPTSTLYFNVYYHLALARYLARDFHGAAASWAECQKVSHTPDKLVSTSYWHYLTLRRLGRDEDARALLAPIRPELEVIENQAYHRLLCAFAAGAVSEALLAGGEGNDPATIGNGVATFLWLAGEKARARELWQKVVDTTPWPAFGHVAAEVELATEPPSAGR